MSEETYMEKAKGFLTQAADLPWEKDTQERNYYVATAQVYATLALAAATWEIARGAEGGK